MSSLPAQHIPQPLNWVKPELDKAVTAVRDALEHYGHSLTKFDPLLPTLDQLHLLRGTLQMLEFYGAALLIEDMEKTVKAILSGEVTKAEDAYEALVQATFSLEGYLDKLAKSPNDIPLVLLPIINDLRASRNEPLLTESALFSPNLSIVPKIPAYSQGIATPKPALSETATQLRPYYQAALLSWYRNPKDSMSMQQLKLVLRNLESSSYEPRIRQLWWVAGGLTEALADKGLTPSVSIRLLMGQIDRYIKITAENKHESIEKKPPVELLKNILFYVAHARSTGERVSTLSRAYQLGSITPTEQDIQNLRNNIRAPQSSTFKTIAQEINKTLQQVKSRIDTHVRSNSKKPESLEDIIQPLKHVADTLSLMSLGKERQLLSRQIEQFVKAITNKGLGRTELMNLASVILHLESVVNNIGNERRMQNRPHKFPENRRRQSIVENSDVDARSLTRLPDTEYRVLIQQAAQQARIAMVDAKNNILAFLTNPSKRNLLEDIGARLNEVKGCLILINKPYAADLMGGLIEYINASIVSKEHVPAQNDMDQFAEAIVGMEYYLEAVSEGRPHLDSILPITHESLKKLGIKVEVPKQIDAKNIPLLETVVTQLHDASKPKAQKVKPSTAEPKAAPVVQVEDERDEELVEIFAEEAYEALSEMGQALQTLRVNNDDQSALANMRRVYHTLKGSGRIAGANELSEFATVIEEFINRSQYHAVEFGQSGLRLLVDAYEILHILIDAFKNRSPIPVRANEIIQQAGLLMSETGIAAEEVVAEEPVAVIKTEEIPPVLVTETVPFDRPLPSQAPSPKPIESSTDVAPLTLLDKIQTIENYISEAVQSSTLGPIPGFVVKLVTELKDLAVTVDIKEFTQLTDLLFRFVRNTSNRADNLSIETLEILHEYCVATREIFFPTTVSDKREMATREVEEHVAPATPTVNAAPIIEKAPETKPPVKATIVTEVKKSEPTQITPTFAHPVESRTPYEEEDSSLIDIFIEEARELLDEAHDNISQWQNQLPSEAQLHGLQRTLHTLKGSARMAGINAVGNMSHSLETLIEQIIDGTLISDPSLKTLSESAFDAVSDMIDDLESGADIRMHTELFDLIARYGNPEALEEASFEVALREEPEDIIEAIEAPAPVEETVTEEIAIEEAQAEVEALVVTAPIPDVTEPTVKNTTETFADETKREPVKIDSRLLDTLVDHASEETVMINRLNDNIGDLKTTLTELDKTVSRLRDQLRDLEFGQAPANKPSRSASNKLDLTEFSSTQETAQRLMESIGDIENLHSTLTRITLEADTLVHKQAKTHSELHEGLLGTRMISFSNQEQRLQRIIRQTARELNKKAQLVMEGTEGALDRALLERLMGPLEHIIRNAVAHGIETPETRLSSNKDETGTVKLRFSKNQAENIIDISDDGAGINLRAIREKAIKLKLIEKDQRVDQADLLNLIFEPGFTTASEVSQIAGRGIGMDAVETEIKSLGGYVAIETHPGEGSTFSIHLPFTIAMNKTMLIRANDATYAIPMSAIEGTHAIASKELAKLYQSDTPVFKDSAHTYPLRYLDSLLNNTTVRLPAGDKMLNLLLLNHQQQYLALHVDEIIETRDSVIKPTGAQLSKVRGVSGATILGDGQVVLIADIPQLFHLAAEKQHLAQVETPSATIQTEQKPLVLVVDDSITVRKVTERFLQRNGYDVMLAKDGIEALEAIEEQKPDIMLLDIEMPRMDGLQVAQHIRKNDDTKDIPIIMITSRSGHTHREAAEKIGVNVFLGKPYQEDALLEHIQSMIKAEN